MSVLLAGYYVFFDTDIHTTIQHNTVIQDNSAEAPYLPRERGDILTTTAIVETTEDTSSKKILFVGDMFFDRYIRTLSERYGEDHLLSCIDDLLMGVDVVVGNLEGPITNNTSVTKGTNDTMENHYTFTFPTTTATLLARHNITVVNLGNNHIGNFGHEGVSSTHAYLVDAGVAYFGGLRGNEPIYRDKTWSYVSYNQFGGQSSGAVAERIKEETAQGQHVIVYAHWGDEYVTTAGYLRDVAYEFIHAGARAVFGSHPHVVIPMEYIDGIPVYYSLGNFIFDQYFSSDVMTGQAVLATFIGDDISTETYTLALKPDGRVCGLQDNQAIGR